MSTELPILKNSACPVCGSNKTIELFELESPYIAGLLYQIRCCDSCSHRYATGPLSEQVLSEVYGEAFHATSQQQAYKRSSAVILNVTRRSQWLRDLGLQGKLLDVGAGRGYFVKAAQRFFEARGIDYSPNAHEYGKALDIVLDSGDFLRAPYESAFDVLTFWDVLASMVDVRATMARAATLLRSGGHAVFTVPMGDSLACRLSGKRWPLWIPPVNLHYFSKESLHCLFGEAGFEIIDMRCRAKLVSLDFLFVKLARSLNLRKLERGIGRIPLKWAVPINLGDIQTVLVRKV